MKHEFLVVSKSMFTADGMPIPCNDKSMLLSTLEEYVEYKLTPPLKPPVSAVESSYIITDAYMAIVNKSRLRSHTARSAPYKTLRIILLNEWRPKLQGSSAFGWCSTDTTSLCP